jgi:hypothetical protein
MCFFISPSLGENLGASSNVLSQPGFDKFSWGKLLPEAYDEVMRHIYDEAIVRLLDENVN